MTVGFDIYCDVCCDVCCDFWLSLLVVTFGIDGCGVTGLMKNYYQLSQKFFSNYSSSNHYILFDAKDKIDTTFAYLGYSFYYAFFRVVWLLDY